MPGTLILLFHPTPARSRANAALVRAAARLAGTDIVDMQAAYPDAAIDTDAEVERLHRADRLVLQFPLQWYSTPPLLKAWQDAVLTRMFYIRPEEGAALRGTPLMLAATAGNHAAAYGPEGENGFTLEELFRSLQATARRCGLRWSAPFSLFSADRLDDAALETAGERYLTHLAAWQAEAVQA